MPQGMRVQVPPRALSFPGRSLRPGDSQADESWCRALRRQVLDNYAFGYAIGIGGDAHRGDESETGVPGLQIATDLGDIGDVGGENVLGIGEGEIVGPANGHDGTGGHGTDGIDHRIQVEGVFQEVRDAVAGRGCGIRADGGIDKLRGSNPMVLPCGVGCLDGDQ